MDVSIPLDLSEFFVWVGSAGVVGWVLSFIVERLWPLLPENFPSAAKHAIVVVASIGLPMLSKVLQDTVSPELIAQLNPWWGIFVTGLLIYLGSQAVHTVRKYYAAQTPADYMGELETPVFALYGGIGTLKHIYENGIDEEMAVRAVADYTNMSLGRAEQVVAEWKKAA